jgi:hypothetical protein
MFFITDQSIGYFFREYTFQSSGILIFIGQSGNVGWRSLQHSDLCGFSGKLNCDNSSSAAVITTILSATFKFSGHFEDGLFLLRN